MKHKFLVILLSLSLSLCFAQKVEILHRSDFRHEYVVGQLDYIEQASDTSRLKYVATLNVQQEKYDGVIAPLIERLITEGKTIGANSYILGSYTENGTTISITVRTFFGSSKFLNENEGKSDKGKIYVLSGEKQIGKEQFFYLNNGLIEFSSDSLCVLNPFDKQFIHITSNNRLAGTLEFKLGYNFKKNKNSHFVIIRSHLNSAYKLAQALALSMASLATSGGTFLFIPLFPENTVDLKYKHGRILLDAYRQRLINRSLH